MVLAAVLLLMLVALAGCGGGDDEVTVGPAIALQDDRIPEARDDEVEQRVAMISETGVGVARVDLFWTDIAPERPADPTDPGDPAYDWDKADYIFTNYAANGIDTIVSAYNTPEWAMRSGAVASGTRINNAFPDPDAYADFMSALATRYSGEYVPEGATEPLPEISHFEIWNEPNFRSFLGPQVEGGKRVAADAYADMTRAAYPVIKDANADAIVIVGVGGPKGASSEGATGARDWLGMLRARDIPLDAYSQHIYPAAAPDVETIAFPSWSSIDGFLEELDAWKPGLDLYITEAGYTTADTEFRNVSVTEEQQADYMKQIFELPQVNQERVAVIVWFNMQDNEFWPAGIIREDGTHKPSYDVFTGLVEQRDGITLPGPDEREASATAP